PYQILLAQIVTPTTHATLTGTQQHNNRVFMLANITYLVEYMSVANRLYAIQYSSDLQNRKSAVPPITGTGNWIQWIDNGQPKTESSPTSVEHRYYRLIELP